MKIPKNVEHKFPAFNCPVFHLREIITCKSSKLIAIALTLKPVFILRDNIWPVDLLLNFQRS
jgi:hypothetical protein